MVPIVVMLAQSREALCVNPNRHDHIVLAELMDRASDLIVQLTYFQRLHLHSEVTNSRTFPDYLRTIPSVISLIRDYYMRPEIAFMIVRPYLHHQLQLDLQRADLDKKSEAEIETIKNTLDESAVAKTVRPLEPPEQFIQHCDEFLLEKTKKYISPKLYAWFWYCTIEDLNLEKETDGIYEREQSYLRIKESNHSDRERKQRDARMKRLVEE